MYPGFSLDELTKFTARWTGAEIEQCVVSAITRARLEDRDVTQQDLIGSQRSWYRFRGP